MSSQVSDPSNDQPNNVETHELVRRLKEQIETSKKLKDENRNHTLTISKLNAENSQLKRNLVNSELRRDLLEIKDWEKRELKIKIKELEDELKKSQSDLNTQKERNSQIEEKLTEMFVKNDVLHTRLSYEEESSENATSAQFLLKKQCLKLEKQVGKVKPLIEQHRLLTERIKHSAEETLEKEKHIPKLRDNNTEEIEVQKFINFLLCIIYQLNDMISNELINSFPQEENENDEFIQPTEIVSNGTMKFFPDMFHKAMNQTRNKPKLFVFSVLKLGGAYTMEFTYSSRNYPITECNLITKWGNL